MSPFVLILVFVFSSGTSAVTVDMPSEAVCNLNKGNAAQHYTYLREAECMRRESLQ